MLSGDGGEMSKSSKPCKYSRLSQWFVVVSGLVVLSCGGSSKWYIVVGVVSGALW